MKKLAFIIMGSLFFLGMSSCYSKKNNIEVTPAQANYSFDWETEKYAGDKGKGRFYDYVVSKAKNGEAKSFNEFVNLQQKSELKFKKNVKDYSFSLKETLYENTNDGLFYQELPKVGRFRVALFATPTMNDNDGGAVAIQLQTHDENSRVIDSMVIVNAFADECSMNRSVSFLQNDRFVINEHYWCFDLDSKGKESYSLNKKAVAEFRIDAKSGRILRIE